MTNSYKTDALQEQNVMKTLLLINFRIETSVGCLGFNMDLVLPGEGGGFCNVYFVKLHTLYINVFQKFQLHRGR